jgi:ABC-type multidrug transport system permease subunit
MTKNSRLPLWWLFVHRLVPLCRFPHTCTGHGTCIRMAALHQSNILCIRRFWFQLTPNQILANALQLITNELHGLVINCDDGNLVPSGTNMIQSHQTCSIPGSIPGQMFVRGEDYALSQGFDYAHRWRNIGIMIAIAGSDDAISLGASGSILLAFLRRSSLLELGTNDS